MLTALLALQSLLTPATVRAVDIDSGSSSYEYIHDEMAAQTFSNAKTGPNKSSACGEEGYTSIIAMTVHLEDHVRSYIKSVMQNKNPAAVKNLSPKEAEYEVSALYVSGICNDLNKVLRPMRVQIECGVSKISLNQVSGENIDASCELTNPARERTLKLKESLKAQTNGNTGIQLGIYSCPKNDREYDLMFATRNSKCGKVMGVIWNGYETTQRLFKSIFMKALAEAPGLYITAHNTIDTANLQALCKWTESCLSEVESPLGRLLYGEYTVVPDVKPEGFVTDQYEKTMKWRSKM
ncbi:hypothetical protein PAPHI01_0587 [Pancytospora philotis]|nr:hypothetical protein PAPHI01_0587 [Pancytospora philotis]